MRANVYCSAIRGLQSPSARIVFSLQVSKDLNREELSEAGVGKSVGCQLVEEPVGDETFPRTLFHHANYKMIWRKKLEKFERKLVSLLSHSRAGDLPLGV